jgi:hypothetical protein
MGTLSRWVLLLLLQDVRVRVLASFSSPSFSPHLPLGFSNSSRLRRDEFWGGRLAM